MNMIEQLTVSRPLSTEDIRAGDYVTATQVTIEWIDTDCDAHLSEAPVRRARIKPDWAGTPFLVKAVCTPFVLVEAPSGKHGTIDTRRYTVARLDPGYAHAAFKCFRKDKRRANGEQKPTKKKGKNK